MDRRLYLDFDGYFAAVEEQATILSLRSFKAANSVTVPWRME